MLMCRGWWECFWNLFPFPLRVAWLKRNGKTSTEAVSWGMATVVCTALVCTGLHSLSIHWIMSNPASEVSIRERMTEWWWQFLGQSVNPVLNNFIFSQAHLFCWFKVIQWISNPFLRNLMLFPSRLLRIFL